MAATRKLQAEIDRCLKKVAEGVDKFDETWNKVHHASNSNQKEKYEEDLKKEIKKLQRLRDQIKTWIASGEIKDKSVLVEKRKLIEAKMEKFKIVERETKTKAYSKEGLTSGQKLDPAERERCDISQWLNQCIETLNIQMDQFEAEIENLSNTKKKKGRNDQAEQMDALNSLLEKHRDHVQKLETLLRMLDNNTVEINQIKDIKDDLDYYIENCQDPEFIENEEIYEDIDGLEEMLLDIGGNEHNTNSVEGNSETMSTNSASSPIPYMHNHSNDANDINEKRRHKSSSEDSKVGSQSTSATVNVKSGIPASTTMTNAASISLQAPPLAQAPPSSQQSKAISNSSSSTVLNNKSNVVNNVPASSISTPSSVLPMPSSASSTGISNAVSVTALQSAITSAVPPIAASTVGTSTPIKTAFNTMVANPNNSSPSSGVSGLNGSAQITSASSAIVASAVTALATSSSSPAASSASSMMSPPGLSQPTAQLQQPLQQTPLQDQPQQQPNFAAAVQQLNGHTSNTTERRSIPSPSPSLPGSIKQPTSQPSHFPGAPMGSNLAAASSSNDTEGLPTLKSIAQEATNRAGLKVPASAQQTQLSIGTTAPTISNSGLFPNPPSKDRSQKTEAHIPPLMGVAPLGPVPLNKDTQLQYAMLEAAYLHMPHPSDSERLRPYLPRNPCPTPAYYPQLPPGGSDEIDFFLRLSTETLFFIFYYMEGTKAQYLAAKALKRQSWRFHTKYLMWFQRHEEPKIINDEYEQGTYVYFDFEKWGQRKKEGFTFEYRFLEDQDLD